MFGDKNIKMMIRAALPIVRPLLKHGESALSEYLKNLPYSENTTRVVSITPVPGEENTFLCVVSDNDIHTNSMIHVHYKVKFKLSEIDNLINTVIDSANG